MSDERVLGSYKLSREAKDLLIKLAKENGISQTAVIELAVREKNKRDHPDE